MMVNVKTCLKVEKHGDVILSGTPAFGGHPDPAAGQTVAQLRPGLSVVFPFALG
jgi:hypothetical protein